MHNTFYKLKNIKTFFSSIKKSFFLSVPYQLPAKYDFVTKQDLIAHRLILFLKNFTLDNPKKLCLPSKFKIFDVK